ncbi:MAG: tetratricopeptide repeat protein [Gemmatimonadota bacterium]|nr:tetratricopeptide repeat protein [Gemmatimonadota bacterium]MDP6802701.1 tetratricopeptide repeat protein [Gemmatimonadota bacterium]MDP7032509.1 tetratricopeptide repeat protein [Gemmatimonadota bacterium]
MTRWTLGLALAIGGLLRFEYLRELSASPFGRHLFLDAGWFSETAAAIASGHPITGPEALFRPPLYPYFLAMLLWFGGAEVLVPRLVQFALGLVQGWMIYRIALRTHGVLVGRIAGVLAFTFGMFIYFEAELLTATLATFLGTAAVFLLLEGRDSRFPAKAAASGVLFGLAGLAHGTLLVGALGAALWVSRRFGRGAAMLFVAAVLLCPGGVAVRNLVLHGEAIPVGGQGGINFYIGNSITADGKSALAPGAAEAEISIEKERYRDTMQAAARLHAERILGRELTVREVDRFWYSKTFEWISMHPRDTAALWMRKLVYVWNGSEIGNNRDFRDQAGRFTPILRFFLLQFSVLLPFALYGMIRGGGRRREQGLLAILLLTHTVVLVAFFVCSRFRLPMIPWLIPFGAAGLVAFLRDLRAGAGSPVRVAAASVALTALFLGTNARVLEAVGMNEILVAKDAPFHRSNLANLYRREGDFDAAIGEYEAAIAYGVSDPRMHLNLANCLAQTGRSSAAREHYRTVLELSPGYEAVVRCDLGVLSAREGDWESALREFRRSLAADPDHELSLVNQAATYLTAGRFEEAIVSYRRLVQGGIGEPAFVRSRLGLAYLEAGLLEEAEWESLEALRMDSGQIVAVVTLGKVYARQGRTEAAERMWEKARQLAPGAPAVEQAIRDARGG